MNIARLLVDVARRQPEQVAITSAERSVTFAELTERSGRIAAGLQALGLQPGDRVALSMQNRLEFLETLYATLTAGLCVVPLNTKFRAAEIAYHLQDSGAACLVYDGATRPDVAAAMSSGHALQIGVAVGTSVIADGPSMHTFDELLSLAPAPMSPVEVPGASPVWLFYTSGTTGRAKGATLTHDNLRFMVVGWCADLMSLGPRDTTLHCAPLTHGAGLHAVAAASRGARQYVLPAGSFDPAVFLDAVAREGATNTFMVPTQIVRVINYEGLDVTKLATMHSIVYGGAPFHTDDLRRAVSLIGPKLVQIYAQGETPMTATYLPHDLHVAADADIWLRSAGVVRTGMEVEIRDEDDKLVEPGVVGEIVVRGPTVMTGYWDKPEATAETIRQDWLHTGDLGSMDGAGRLFVADRLKDMIISGGANVYAREVEDVILAHPGVQAVAVVGIPDREWGERVVAAVIAVPGRELTAEDLHAHCHAELASYKCPREYAMFNELPLSAYGKVLKRELRQTLAERLAPAT